MLKKELPASINNKSLLLMSKLLKKNKIDVFPFYGTLLGLIRDGSCIENDDDIDFLVNISEKEKIVSLFNSLGLKIVVNQKSFTQIAYLIDKHVVLCDFYFYSFEDEKLIEKWNFFGKEADPNFHIHFEKDLFFPSRSISWNEIDLEIPNQSEQILEMCYGDRWNEKMSKSKDYRQIIINNEVKIIYGN